MGGVGDTKDLVSGPIGEASCGLSDVLRFAGGTMCGLCLVGLA